MDELRGFVLLSARYPDGSLGWALAAFDGLAWSDFRTPPEAPCPPCLEEAVDWVTAYYHARVGPAYSRDDFSYTFWLFESSEQMYECCGEWFLAADGMPDYGRPEVGGADQRFRGVA